LTGRAGNFLHWLAYFLEEMHMSAIRPLVAGNWKMNGLSETVSEIEALSNLLDAKKEIKADVMIFPPATLIMLFAKKISTGHGISIGGQDCHSEVSGAHTGDISAEMLADAGATAVIAGHSERRSDHGESDQLVRAKAMAAHRAGLNAIICVGESEAQRKSGETLNIVGAQIANSLPSDAHAENTIIAYEPVWAIGTGLTPTSDDVAEVHAHIRAALGGAATDGEGEKMRILYGGSVKPENAAELMAVDNVNGALVGGASLKANDFFGIISVYSG